MLQSMGSKKVGHDWATEPNWSKGLILWILKNLCIPGINPTWLWCMIFVMYCCIQFTSILLTDGDSQLCRSFLVGCSPALYFCLYIWCHIQKNHCQDQCQETFPYVPSRSFMISGVQVKSLNHFELITMSSINKGSSVLSVFQASLIRG